MVKELLASERPRAIAEIIRSAFAAVRPNTGQSVVAWAEANRIMPPSGAVPGKYRVATTPYAAEMLECFHPDHPARIVVFQKGAQIGGSDIGYNAIGFWLDQVPGNIILALPTENLYREVSRGRITPMIDNSPALSEKVTSSERRDGTNRINRKEFPGGVLAIITAKSAPSLRLMNARYVIADEVDAYPLNIPGEGDPMDLLRKRMSTYQWESKFFVTSTPLLKDSSRIAAMYEATDRRRYYVPCPYCDGYQTLEWERMVWERGDATSARMKCVHCKKEFDDSYKEEMLAHGHWIAEGKASTPDAVGFHLSALYAPPGWFSWAQAVDEWEKSAEDEAKRQVFTNTVLGNVFEHYAYRPTINIDTAEQVRYGDDGVHAPNEVLVLTAGIDTQHNRAECYIYGWGKGELPFAIDYLEVRGDLSKADFWRELERRLHGLRYRRADGRILRVACTAIDSGGRNTVEVYRWALGAQMRNRVKRLIVCKGAPGYDRQIITTAPTPSKRKVLPRAVDLYRIGVDTCKSTIYRKIDAGEWTTPVAWANGEFLTNEYYLQLTAEVREKKFRHGFANHFWVKRRDRNEALDCAAYAYAALKHLAVDWDALEKNIGAMPTETERKEAKAAADKAAAESIDAEPVKEKPQVIVPKKKKIVRLRWDEVRRRRRR